MRNKLLVSTAVLAAAIAVASCEKTPSEEPAGNQSGSATSEGRQSQSAPAQQRGTEEPVQQTQPSDAQQHSTQTANQPAAGGNEQQSKEGQREQEAGVAQDRKATPKTTRTGATAAGARPAGKIAPAVLARIRFRAPATL